MGDMSRVQSRKWQVTINNPEEHGLTHEDIREKMEGVAGLLYWCMCDEEGDECETRHTHVYMHFTSPRDAERIDNLFPKMHREKAMGTAAENRAYILKDGPKFNKDETGHYSYDDKSGKHHEGINFSDTFEEIGECPQERQGKSKDAEVIVNMIKDGATDSEIVDAVPSAYSKLEHIHQTRALYRAERFKREWRSLEVVYIFGKTGLGKTRAVMETYGYQEVYRVTDYRKYPFDDYDCEDVVMFEEFRSDIKIGDMLKYLDGYPLRLTARFQNKQACFTRAFIVSNVPPEDQYRNVDRDSVDAFWRRVNEIRSFTGYGTFTSYRTLDDYKKRHAWIEEAEDAETLGGIETEAEGEEIAGRADRR